MDVYCLDAQMQGSAHGHRRTYKYMKDIYYVVSMYIISKCHYNINSSSISRYQTIHTQSIQVYQCAARIGHPSKVV